MFSSKRRIAQLEEALADKERLFHIQNTEWREYTEELDKVRSQVEYLICTIRDMDEQIYKMSQCNCWEAMRPHYTNLAEGMTVRKRAESDRIGELIRPELIKTYNNDQKRLK